MGAATLLCRGQAQEHACGCHVILCCATLHKAVLCSCKRPGRAWQAIHVMTCHAMVTPQAGLLMFHGTGLLCHAVCRGG